jgi:hypothetical protein
MKSGKGKPCGASHISASKVCRVSMAPEVQKALNAVAGEVGAATLKEAVKKHAGGKGVARLREIRADIRNEMGGVIVKGPKADELKKRLQAEGLLPAGKAKSVAPEVIVNGSKSKVPSKPDELYGAWETGQLKKFRDGMADRDPQKFELAIKRIDGELARREAPVAKPLPTDLKNQLKALAAKDPQVPEKGRTTLENEDLSRIMRGESPLNMKIVSDAGELGMGVIANKSLNSQTNANESTQAARRSARDTDERITRNGITQQEGDKNYNWGSSIGSGSKKLGQGAFGTVIKEPGKGNAVKRGDVGENEAKLIDRIGKVDLGPKLKAAELDGDTGRPGTKLGRLAMTVVPGKPIGYKKANALVGGVKVADAYWTARANLHRMGIAHNDMHIDNVFIDNKGKGRFVDMGLAQGSPKAALAEAMGVFQPPKGSSATRVMGAAGQGDWQTRRWDGTAGKLLETYESRLKDGLMPALTEKARKELEEKAPVLARIQQNKADVQFAMKKDGFTNDDIASVMDHGIRSPLDTYNQGVWSRMTDDQAMRYINMLYEGV